MVQVDSAAESLTRRAYAQLRQDIIEGTLPPGLKLKIQELTKAYNTGASPIREALSHLASDRLVNRIEGRGFRVSRVSREEFLDLLRVRLWVEGRALAESIAIADPAWEDAVLSTNFRLGQSARSTRADSFEPNVEWEEKHKLFHMALIQGCQSPIAIRICDQLYDQNIRYRNIAGPFAYPGRNVGDEHDAIAKAALARDTDNAVRLLHEHYASTANYVRDRLPPAE
ncbi:GntR family transcriptional regulator [Amorphus sp. MBR-141]